MTPVTKQEIIDVLTVLSCLGNGDRRGNSTGNDIASHLLDRIDSLGIEADPMPQVSDEYCDDLLRELDAIALEVCPREFGLPLAGYDNIQDMRDAVRNWLKGTYS